MQLVSEVRSAALYRARWEEPATPLHDIVNGLVESEFPGVRLTYPEVIRAFGTELKDPLLALTDPSTAAHWHAKGLELCREGLWCNGLVCLDKALDIDGNSPDLWASRGTGLLRLASAVCPKPMIRLLDADVTLQDQLLHVQDALDDSDECFDRALSLCPANQEAAIGKSFLNSLRTRSRTAEFGRAPLDDGDRETGPASYLRKLQGGPLSLGDSGGMVQGIMEDLLSGLPPTTHQFVSRQVAAGELLSVRADAAIRIAEAPYRGYALVVHRGLRVLLRSLGKVLLVTSETTPNTYVGPAPISPRGTDDDAVQFLKQVMASVKKKELPRLSPRDVSLQDGTLTLAGFLEVYGVAFVVGHELGHFLLGHLRKNHDEILEIEADRAGLSLMLNWVLKGLRAKQLRDHHIAAALAGAELALVCLRILEDLGLTDTKYHPSMARRFATLRECTRLHGSHFQLANMLMQKALELRNRALDQAAVPPLGLLVEQANIVHPNWAGNR